jgi:hypothetical protein
VAVPAGAPPAAGEAGGAAGAGPALEVVAVTGADSSLVTYISADSSLAEAGSAACFRAPPAKQAMVIDSNDTANVI